MRNAVFSALETRKVEIDATSKLGLGLGSALARRP
jgi:hypothetical protein